LKGGGAGPDGDRSSARKRLRHTLAGSAKGRMRWAQLLKRVFDVDIEQCPYCGGLLKRIAAIEEPAVIQRILAHPGLAAQPPPRAPAVRVDLLPAA